MSTPPLEKLSIQRLILHIVSQCTKFEVSSLSGSRDILRGLQILNGSRDMAMLLSGTVCHLRLAMINLCSLTIKIWKTTENVEIVEWLGVRGHPRSLAMSSFNRTHIAFYSTLIESMSLSCTIFELQRVICQKSPILTYPTAFGSPVEGDSVRISPRIFAVRKPESMVYRVVLLASVILCLAVLIQYRSVTDGQTDRRTYNHG